MDFNLINTAHAASEGTPLHAETEVAEGSAEHAASGGLSIDPAIVGFQALNFLVLLAILSLILYKPLLKILNERRQKIAQGIENAERAELLLKESTASREKMIKEARAESQAMVEAGRTSGEQVRVGILTKASEEAQHILDAGKVAVESERSKAMLAIRAQAVEMVVTATEKLLREKMNSDKDAALIKESLESFAK